MKSGWIRCKTAENYLVLVVLFMLGAAAPVAAMTREKALTLSELPVPGQAAISAAIGNDSATFHVGKASLDLANHMSTVSRTPAMASKPN